MIEVVLLIVSSRSRCRLSWFGSECRIAKRAFDDHTADPREPAG